MHVIMFSRKESANASLKMLCMICWCVVEVANAASQIHYFAGYFLPACGLCANMQTSQPICHFEYMAADYVRTVDYLTLQHFVINYSMHIKLQNSFKFRCGRSKKNRYSW